MFNNRSKELKQQIEALKDERDALKEDIKQLKLDHKLQEEDIKHMVKMTQEKHDIEYERKVMELQRKTDDKIAAVKDTYRDKLEGYLNQQITKTEAMTKEILDRLPNVTAKLNGKL
jgi:N-acetyl-anhydromuramyl-L-alanine amidase AmpD